MNASLLSSLPGSRFKLSVAIVVFGVLLDALSKQAARMYLSQHDPVQVLSGFRLSLGYNPGIAFGIFPVDSKAEFYTLVLGQFVVIAALSFFMARSSDLWQKASLAAIVSGAAGNLIDRTSHGAVTDFLDLYAGDWHWPTFNLADVFIVTGVAALVLRDFLIPAHLRTETNNGESQCR